jgi:hypothetical protein
MSGDTQASNPRKECAMQSVITVIVFAFLLLLLSVLPGWEQDSSQRNATERRAPIVVDTGA